MKNERNYPTSHRATTTPPPEVPPGTADPISEVKFDAYLEAIAPILKLVGTDAMSMFSDGFSVSSDRIEFVSVVPVPDVEPVKVGADEFAEWGWPVSVRVDRP